MGARAYLYGEPTPRQESSFASTVNPGGGLPLGSSRDMQVVSACGMRIAFIPPISRTPALRMAAVRQNGNAIEFMQPYERTPEVCLAAVTKNGTALRHLDATQKSEAVCLAALKQNIRCVVFLEPGDLRQAPGLAQYLDMHWDDAAGHLNPMRGAQLAKAIVSTLDRIEQEAEFMARAQARAQVRQFLRSA
jgi:hypothetical protein